MPHNCHKNSLYMYHNSPRNKIVSNSSDDIFQPPQQLTSLETVQPLKYKISQTAYPPISDLKTWKHNTSYPFTPQPFASCVSHRSCQKKNLFMKSYISHDCGTQSNRKYNCNCKM